MRTYLNEGMKKVMDDSIKNKGAIVRKLGPRTTVLSNLN
jgi:hypothetical protein